MRSGLSAEILATPMPSARLSTSGLEPPRLGSAHGHTPNGWSPHQLVIATGTTPTASRSSCSVKPALTTRFGGAEIFVSPNRCLTVTEPSLATAPGFSLLHAATATTPAVI